MGAKAARVLLGEIGPAHGVRGHVLIRTYTEAPEDIASYGVLEDEPGTRTFEISLVRVTAKGIVARIAGIEDRNTAEALRGIRLYIERDRLPPTEEEEFYHSDLVGLSACKPDGTPLGKVIAVHNFGAGDILEIRLEDGGATDMVPFTHAFVPEVDLSAGQLTVTVPIASRVDQQGT